MRTNLIYYKYKYMIQLNNFDSQLLKINKRENRENNNIYYISYRINKPEHNINSINNLYFVWYDRKT